MLSMKDLKLRSPKIFPYFQHYLASIIWNAKSIFSFNEALRQRLKGKTVLITGASSGIGELASYRLAEAGAKVLMVARSAEKLNAMAADIIAKGGKAHAYPGDLSDLEDCDRICREALADHGQIDILINNAGRSIRRSVKFSLDRFHDYQRTMQINYFAAIRMAMNILPGMLARNEGHIINVSTLGVQTCPARFSAYLGSKWALEGWSWVTANELAHTNINISTINYPLVSTPMIAPSKVYKYMPWKLSPKTAVRWMLDIVITRNKRKVDAVGVMGLFLYYLLPKTAENFINFTYQIIHETPPESYQATKTEAARQTTQVQNIVKQGATVNAD